VFFTKFLAILSFDLGGSKPVCTTSRMSVELVVFNKEIIEYIW
jgi:hypothetical protein